MVVNFWASWCIAVCRKEAPLLEGDLTHLSGSRAWRHREEGFTILAISIDTVGPATVAALVKAPDLTCPIGSIPR
jgi:thiol-disulfide isomerase/thioredoxin